MSDNERAPGRSRFAAIVTTRSSDAAFGVGAATAHRYVTEVIELLADLAPDLRQAMRISQRKAHVILDGTLVATDRLSGGNDRLHYSGKHRRHGVNVQFLTDPHGELIWASPALPLTAAREHGIIDALIARAIGCYADRGMSESAARSVLPTSARSIAIWGNARSCSTGTAPRSAPRASEAPLRSRDAHPTEGLLLTQPSHHHRADHSSPSTTRTDEDESAPYSISAGPTGTWPPDTLRCCLWGATAVGAWAGSRRTRRHGHLKPGLHRLGLGRSFGT
ncbi:hypothetical protein [Actinomadura rubrisoli]|uniref:Transposase n=1 Tax=Actinomadura rubrisoli TaxID=2530368 RepID=A0A4R5BD48_9ACTN|nr:hypothetical protein [Actinomadura rubrisoli]TDD83485.1 hypothetical protein E1298_21295 [Actinomadura rubrisoli]